MSCQREQKRHRGELPGAGPRSLGAWGWLLAIALGASAARADAPAALRIGATAVPAAQLRRLLEAMPPVQRDALLAERRGTLAAVVDGWLVPALLFSEEAKARGLDRDPAMRLSLRDALARVLEARLRDALGPVDQAAIERYHAEHRRHYQRPHRIALWRIRVATAEAARALLGELGEQPTIEHWDRLARERSTDQATAMRRGNLGFVDSEGHTERPRVRVAPELYAAAAKLADGELSREPVAEAEHFAVLWRRGSSAELRRPVQEARVEIEAVITRGRLAQRMEALTGQLRQRQLGAHHPELLELLPTPYPQPAPSLQPAPVPSSIPVTPDSADPTPRKGPAGLR